MGIDDDTSDVGNSTLLSVITGHFDVVLQSLEGKYKARSGRDPCIVMHSDACWLQLQINHTSTEDLDVQRRNLKRGWGAI